MLEVISVKNDLNIINQIELFFSDVFDNHSILDDIKNNPFTKYFALIKDNNVIGFINFDIIYDRCELVNINILDSEKGNGYGNILMEYMINYVSDIKNITLEVRIDNYVAIKMYEKFGFIKKAIRKNYYQGIDGILMEKVIER